MCTVTFGEKRGCGFESEQGCFMGGAGEEREGWDGVTKLQQQLFRKKGRKDSLARWLYYSY